MTSLVLFNSEQTSQADDFVKPGLDWGTGNTRKRASSEPSSDHPTGTFLYTGEPTQQNYRNTDITLSNVRINDELIPAPVKTNIGPQQIPLNFPSNHPFSSHISEKALFPNASFSLGDRPSTDTDPYIVTHKIRGNPYRREVHLHGLQQQGNIQWPDKQYMQLSRSLSDVGSSPIYPWPRKMFAPNDSTNIPINSSANIVKNKERTLYESTYQGDYTQTDGMGSHVSYDTTVKLSPTEQLKPFFKKTLNPVKPMEDMSTMHIHGNHRQPSALEKQKTTTTTTTRNSSEETIKLMSADEKLDDQLRNGTDYVNLPAHQFPIDRAPTWTPRPVDSSYPSLTERPRKEIRFLHHLKPSTAIPQITRDRHLSDQQIEAENRLEQLELIRPQDNLNLLNIKFRTLQHQRHARPTLPQYRDAYVNTLYDQVGTYIQERSGLYHTETYDPNALTQAIPDLETVSMNDDDNENLLKDENYLGELLDNGEQIQKKSKPKLFQYKTFNDYQATRNRLLKKFRVPDDASTVDLRVQEGSNPFIQRESVYGQSYNTRKFLQENTLSSQARSDPTCLMSTRYNTNLERVRSMNSYPTKSLLKPVVEQQQQQQQQQQENISQDIILGPFLPPSPYHELYSSKYITEHTDGYSRRSTNRVYESPFKNSQDMIAYKFHKKQSTPVALYPQMTGQIPAAAKVRLGLPGPEILSRSIEPKLEPYSIYQRSYKDISYHEAIVPTSISKYSSDQTRDNEQNLSRGRQWKLIDLQDRWSKTKAQRQYHINHPEYVPYVAEGTMRAKKEIVIADLIERERMMTVR